MGPTNIALVKLYRADQALRAASAELESATKNVRVQERKLNDLNTKLHAAQTKLKEAQAHSSNLELDIKSRDEHIEKLRTQQAGTSNAKEYQAFLVEINTNKVDKAKSEENLLVSMELVEKTSSEVKELNSLANNEQVKLNQMKSEIGEKIISLQSEIDSLKGPREEATSDIPPKALESFEKLADRYEGEALAALSKPNKRLEEYLCSVCNMSLVVDTYYKLHSRDELIFCTNCRRILYIPDDLPLETAVHKRKVQKKKTEPSAGEIGAYVGRQSTAADVLKSVTLEEEPQPEVANTETADNSNSSGN